MMALYVRLGRLPQVEREKFVLLQTLLPILPRPWGLKLIPHSQVSDAKDSALSSKMESLLSLTLKKVAMA
jgi:hypothetical protein